MAQASDDFVIYYKKYLNSKGTLLYSCRFDYKVVVEYIEHNTKDPGRFEKLLRSAGNSVQQRFADSRIARLFSADSSDRTSEMASQQPPQEGGPSGSDPQTDIQPMLEPSTKDIEHPPSAGPEETRSDGYADSTGSMKVPRVAPITVTSRVTYVPPQPDRFTEADANESNPLYQIASDVLALAWMIRSLPWIFFPLWTTEPTHEFYPRSFQNIGAKLLLACASPVSFIIAIAIPIVMMLPVPTVMLWAGLVLYAACNWLLNKYVQGPTAVMSEMLHVIKDADPNDRKVDRDPGLKYCEEEQGMSHVIKDAESSSRKTDRDLSKYFEKERWLFLSGILSTGSDVQKNVDAIAKLFGRPVLGIHSKTHGLVADMIECLVQRSFAYSTRNGRVAYEAVRACITDEDVERVVIIAHSQGGIEASLIVDRLLMEVPRDVMSKLEVYTFGCVANHFNNPVASWLRSGTSSDSSTSKNNSTDLLPAGYTVGWIEHYVNQNDMISNWGLLLTVYGALSKRYAGGVFVLGGASGHFFNQHYLSTMFPLDVEARNDFLDQVVRVKTDMPRQSEAPILQDITELRTNIFRGIFGNTISSLKGLKRLWFFRWDIKFGDDGKVLLPVGKVDPTYAAFLGGSFDVEGAKGKKVRELSRLWRYIGGAVPPPPGQ